MAVTIGDVLCFKTTGELCVVMGEVQPGDRVYVRRPTMNQGLISYSADVVYQAELETPEVHLRGEAKEMLLKVQIQNELQEEIEAKKKPLLDLVN